MCLYIYIYLLSDNIKLMIPIFRSETSDRSFVIHQHVTLRNYYLILKKIIKKTLNDTCIRETQIIKLGL